MRPGDARTSLRSVVQDLPIGPPPSSPPPADHRGDGGSGPDRASLAPDRPYAIAFALCAVVALAPMALFK